MSREKRWTKHYNTPLTIKALEKYLEGILIHKGNYADKGTAGIDFLTKIQQDEI